MNGTDPSAPVPQGCREPPTLGPRIRSSSPLTGPRPCPCLPGCGSTVGSSESTRASHRQRRGSGECTGDSPAMPPLQLPGASPPARAEQAQAQGALAGQLLTQRWGLAGRAGRRQGPPSLSASLCGAPPRGQRASGSQRRGGPCGSPSGDTAWRDAFGADPHKEHLPWEGRGPRVSSRGAGDSGEAARRSPHTLRAQVPGREGLREPDGPGVGEKRGAGTFQLTWGSS